MTTQQEKVLDYMTRFGSITPLEAMADLGIMRLAARIWDLKRTGTDIVDMMEEGRNRLGEVTRYSRYTLRQVPATSPEERKEEPSRPTVGTQIDLL